MELKTKKQIFGQFLFLAGTVFLFGTIFFLSLHELDLFENSFLDSLSQWKFPWQKNKDVLIVGGKQKVYTSDEFVLHVGRVADRLKINSKTKIPLEDGESIKNSKAKFAFIKPFKEEWEFTELNPVLKEFELSVTDEVGLEICHYNKGYYFFPDHYTKGDKFKVKGPKYLVHFDGKTYLISQSNKLWRRRY